MRTVILVGTIAIALGSAGQAYARALTAPEKRIIEEAVSEQFLDPDTAKFRWLPLPSKLQGSLYCGSVNAKNRFGAYTGYNAFAVVVELQAGKVASAVSLTAIRPYDAEVYRSLCATKGLDTRLAR